MSWNFQFNGTVTAENKRTDMYKLNGVTIGVSESPNFMFDRTENTGGETVICVSFSYENRPIPPEVIEYALHHFGIDISEKYFVHEKPCFNYNSGKMLDITYYEQVKYEGGFVS